MKKFLYNIFLCFIFISCEEDHSGIIDPSIPFYQNLAVEYNVTQNVTGIGANFNKKDKEGANLRLPEKGILFNGEEPSFLGIGYYMYMLSKPGLIPVIFTFNRWKGQTYINQVSINDVSPIAIPDSFRAIHNQKITIIKWEGNPIGEDEFIQVHITYNGGVYNTNSDLEGVQNIAFHFSNLTSATKGTLYLSRVRILPLQESDGNAGGNIQVSYVQNKEIEFK